MLRRVLVVLCLMVLATAGAVRPWRDGDGHVRATTVEASGRALGAAHAVRGTFARQAMVWLPAVPRERGGPLEAAAPTIGAPLTSAPEAPRATRRPARAPPTAISPLA